MTSGYRVLRKYRLTKCESVISKGRPYGYPTIGFWSDNGGEFRNSKMEEFVNKLGFKIKFTQAFSPWSNGINERNHYNCDVIVRKIMEEDKKVGLGEAVDMASWMHNTNVNVLGFQPLQLMTGKSVMIPGLTMGNIATDSVCDDEMVRNIMERHYLMMKEFRMLEFSKKLRKANKTRMKGYEDIKIDTGDLVFYQYEDKKAWLGPERVFAVNEGYVLIFCTW